MPKVSRKEAAKEAALPLKEVPVGMEIEGSEPLPSKPAFGALTGSDAAQKVEFRRVREPTRSRKGGKRAASAPPPLRRQLQCLPQVPVPQHRMTPLKTSWMQLYEPITNNLKLDMRMNLKTKKVRSHGRMEAG
jgi:hypothetical protein